MKTPEEIKKGLKVCAHGCECKSCPYGPDDCCLYRLKSDSLALIEQLEKKAQDAEAAIQEKDRIIALMIEQMAGDCGVCKHREANGQPCAACLMDHNRPAWEYEGLPGA